jgi:hypothetical protein
MTGNRRMILLISSPCTFVEGSCGWGGSVHQCITTIFQHDDREPGSGRRPCDHEPNCQSTACTIHPHCTILASRCRSEDGIRWLRMLGQQQPKPYHAAMRSRHVEVIPIQRCYIAVTFPSLPCAQPSPERQRTLRLSEGRAERSTVTDLRAAHRTPDSGGVAIHDPAGQSM